jgi:hypothetical protein
MLKIGQLHVVSSPAVHDRLPSTVTISASDRSYGRQGRMGHVADVANNGIRTRPSSID